MDTFENICKEDGSITLGDGTVKIFPHASASQDDVGGGTKAFLDYVGGMETRKIQKNS